MKIATLFSGGLAAPEQALKQMKIDHEVVFAAEIDKFARQNYLANHGEPTDAFYYDVKEIDGFKYRDRIDVLIGGSPCTSFSIAGKRKGVDDPRGQLIYEYHRIVDEVRPKIFIYENVTGFLTIDKEETFKNFLKSFEDIWYFCRWSVLNTKDYGVPQNRKRVYIVGFLDEDAHSKFNFEEKQPLTKTLIDLCDDEADEKYFLHDKYQNYVLDEKRQKKKYTQINGEIALTQRARQYANWNGDFLIVNTSGNSLGGMYYTFPATLNNVFEKYGTFPDFLKLRKLTPRECFRLQGCDDSFKIVVSDSQAYKIAGNAMSVNILEMIFRSILKTKE